MYPENYRYTREHEWIKVEDKKAVVGITHYAQEQLGDIVYVELPKEGAHFGSMESFGTVESVKAVSEIYCPVAGTVEEVNAALATNPALVNQDPHGAGWLIKLVLDDPHELEKLFSAKDYEAFIRTSAGE